MRTLTNMTRISIALLVLGLCLATLPRTSAQERQRKPVRKPKRALIKAQPARPEPPSDIKANIVECVEPEVGQPPAMRSNTTRRKRLQTVKRPQRTSKDGSMLSFSPGAVRTTTLAATPAATATKAKTSATDKLAPAVGADCRSQAVHGFYNDGMVLPDMPAINFPEQPCDDRGRCEATTKAWMRAHYYVWIARLVMHHIAALDHPEKRSWAWTRPGLDSKGKKTTEKSSPEYWFGKYSEKRFWAVKDGIDKLWDVMKSNKTGGIGVKLRCPNSNQTENVCNTAKPAAHHIVKGYVDLCAAFYGDRKPYDQARVVAHELLHHLWIDWDDVWVAVQDKHYHGHGTTCVGSPNTAAQYGEDKIRHLVTYRNSKGSSCGHLDRNVRNNDTYAYFIMWMGEMVYNGSMTQWPAPADPTPQPPQCVGDENCLCVDKNTWPGSDPFEPDGDYSAGQWCEDNDGEMTCRATKFGATTRGICKKCDDVRGPGCECDNARPCDVGECFGADTFGGGTGHCFVEPPPKWACLADCDRLLNDDNAWCYADYPTGEAHCMDYLCTEPVAFNCNKEGKVCRYGECVVECQSNAECQQKGYPSYYTCNQSRCQHGM